MRRSSPTRDVFCQSDKLRATCNYTYFYIERQNSPFRHCHSCSRFVRFDFRTPDAASANRAAEIPVRNAPDHRRTYRRADREPVARARCAYAVHSPRTGRPDIGRRAAQCRWPTRISLREKGYIQRPGQRSNPFDFDGHTEHPFFMFSLVLNGRVRVT